MILRVAPMDIVHQISTVMTETPIPKVAMEETLVPGAKAAEVRGVKVEIQLWIT